MFYLFESIKESIKDSEIILNICRDFDGKFNEIKNNLNYFLIEKFKLKIDVDNISFCKLSKDSNAHNYYYLMRKDFKNQLKTYVEIELEQIEKYL